MKETKILKALGDDTRLKILKFLLNRERCVCEIFPYVKRKQSTVSIQLSKLESVGLITSRREGKNIFYRIKDYRIRDIFKILGYVKNNNQA
jgi:ArsR family transcriptional regulator